MEKTVNFFLLKRTQLAQLLAVSVSLPRRSSDLLPEFAFQAMPISAPTFRGYVEFEVKRGKWSKRWMELREHGLWLSKRDSVSF
jgi:hypothetical protein